MTKYWIPISLAVCFITALLVRILPPYNQIFTDMGIKFAMNDAYYHMRLIDNLVYNFPHFSYYDPYFVFPGTTVIGGAHFFDWLVASITWISGLGNPTQATIDIVGVYLPTILAALVVIPVYFIGKSVFNKWVGVIGALLVAILPGEFLGRSILGATDHHVAEVLFSTTAVMFFILAVKSVSTKWTRVFTVLAGVFMGVYLLTWLGGLLFMLIISLFLIIHIISNHLRGASSTRIAIITATIFAITLMMNYSNLLPKEVLLALGLSVILPVILSTLSWIMIRKKWHPAVFPSAIIISGILFLVVVNWIYPSFTGYLGMLLPSGSTAATTLELQPMLSPNGQFTWSVLWNNFTTTSILTPIAVAVLFAVTIRNKAKDETGLLLLIWSVIMIALMLNQRRYAYYVAVNASILAAYLSILVIQWTIRMAGRPAVKKKKSRKALRKLAKKGVVAAPVKERNTDFFLPAMIVITILVILIPANVNLSVQTAKGATFAPSDAWQSALLWMRGNTAEPFQGESLYAELIPLSKKNEPPVADYTVSSWWDYGYWITRTGHRIPNANPAQNVDAIERIANLFLSEGDDYRSQVDVLKSRYIVLDDGTALNKFYAVASWGGRNSSEYFGVYEVQDVGGYKSVVLFYPEYYETLVSRLYNFDGEEVVPEQTIVIHYNGSTVLDAQEFTDYQMAVDYVAGNPDTRIVGVDPSISPVPLEEVDYELVYGSEELVNNMPEVKIYEYTGDE